VRWAFRAPLRLYRANLGWLFGHHLARITHVGRRTRRSRKTVVEVVRYDPRTREIVVAAGWGDQTEWYRNILASPALEIRSGRTAYRPTQHLLTPEETYAEIQEYTRRHPWLARFTPARLLGIPFDATEPTRRAMVDATLGGVEFRPRTVEPDLVTH
jgi:deazaflavin-dependent oxidoreductase (nitroreductase family)